MELPEGGLTMTVSIVGLEDAIEKAAQLNKKIIDARFLVDELAGELERLEVQVEDLRPE